MRSTSATLNTNATMPTSTKQIPAMKRASAPRREPTSTPIASSAFGGSRCSHGHAGSSAVSSTDDDVRNASSASPTMTAAIGHTTTSPGQIPVARTTSASPNTTAPNATFAVGSNGRRTRAGASAGASRINAQPRRYRAMPRPLATVSTTNPQRTTIGSRPKVSASPTATPATMRPSTGRTKSLRVRGFDVRRTNR